MVATTIRGVRFLFIVSVLCRSALAQADGPHADKPLFLKHEGWTAHFVEQLNGEAPRIKSAAGIQVITKPWEMGAVYYPYLIYLPEKNRLLMQLMWGQETQSGIVYSDDGGATWTRPKRIGDGWSTGLTFLNGGEAVLKRENRYVFTRDYGTSWNGSVPAPPCKDSEPFYEDSPFLVDRDPESGRVTRLWATGKKTGLACLLRTSDDGGRSWSPCRHIPQWGRTGEIVLHRARNGNLIAACRVNLPTFDGKIDHFSGLGVSVSKDNGRTWSDLDILYAWGRHMSSMVTLAGGDIVLTYVVRKGYVNTSDGFRQFGIEAVISRDHGLTWDLDHRYVLAVWRENRKSTEPNNWYASPQRTATVLLPDGSLITAFGTGYRHKGAEGKRTHSPQDIAIVRWRPGHDKVNSDSTIADASVRSELRNVFDPQISEYAMSDPDLGYVVFQHNNLQLASPSHVPPRGAFVRKVACELARGEYEPIQIGVHALTQDLNNLQLDVEFDLEVRVYRLIDGKVRKMLLGYSNPVPQWSHSGCLDESNVISSVGKGRTGIFWIVVHAKADAAPGMHRGKIRITSGRAGKLATELELELRVRSFVLQRPRITYFPFFYIEWGMALPKFAQTDEWFRSIYRDMAEHSHNSVTFFGYPGGPGMDLTRIPAPDNPYMSKLLPMGNEVGLFTPDIPCISFETNVGLPESEGGPSVAQKNKAMDWYESERRRQGWPELIRYSYDEPGYPSRHSPGLEKTLKPFRDVRMRVCTAMGAMAAYGLGDLYDIWIVYAGEITPEMLAEARRLGAEVWSYSCNLYPDQSISSRYYAGLYMWAYGLKGHTTWHHYAQGGYKHIWMREGDKRPMPTVGWETRRDGIDDYRYLQMLEDSIAANPGNVVAAKAQNWLASLRKRIVGKNPHLVKDGDPLPLDEYDRIRSRAADYIEKLGPVPEGKVQILPAKGLKDEGKAYRGKSVQECMAGLRSNDSSVRRAAAWALFEMGPQAVPATEALADLLTDAEVRMPALRALEAIGPQAYPAIPKINSLLNHSDRFVRLGATFALGTMGTPWKVEGETSPAKSHSSAQAKVVAELLRVGLMDEFQRVSSVAGEALVRMGPAAKPALPNAIQLLDRPYSIWIWEHTVMVRRIIAAIGPEAEAAVPKLVEIVREGKGNPAGEILALAAIGRSAREAIPVLEKSAADEKNRLRGRAYYALFCIRGRITDLQNMVDLLKRDAGGRAEMARYLDALGVKARPVASGVRQMIKLKEFDKQKEKLESFLKKVERVEGPTPIIP